MYRIIFLLLLMTGSNLVYTQSGLLSKSGLSLDYLTPMTDLAHFQREEEVLMKRDRECAEAANKSVMETLWSCWHEDAVILLGNDMLVKGKSQIKEFTTRAREDSNFEISWEAEGAGVSPGSNMGYTYGVGTITRSGKHGEPITDTQPYLCVWKKDSVGNWRIIVEK